ncbi:MAG: PDZ domain-containing protein [Planctomycetota bacterium]|nr:MAG: PDZ domain-containing protein [Planctomycetota bacterium]
MYIVNMRHVAFDLRMAGQDRMDWKTVQRCAELLNEMDGEANFKLEENRQHRWMTDKVPEILEWFGKTRRVLYPKHVSLRTKEEEFGKSYWVRIDEIGDCKNNAEFEKDWSREATGQKGVKMGFYRDDQYTGEGVQVGRILPDSPADKCGLEAGDIIYRVGGHDIIKWEDLGEALSNFKIGDETTIMVERKGEDTELEIKFTEIKIPQQPGQPEMKPFPYDSARVEARIGRSNKISLKVAKVRRLTLFLHSDMGLDLSEAVKIMVNDNEVFSGLVKENAEILLEHARVFIDTKRVFTAAIAIDVKSGKGKALTGIKAPGSAKKADKPEEKKPEKKEPVEKEPVKKEKPVEKKPVEKKEPKKEEKKEDKKWR